jgi:HEAT repeats
MHAITLASVRKAGHGAPAFHPSAKVRAMRFLLPLVMLLGSACTLHVPVKNPAASRVRYESAAQAGPARFESRRPSGSAFSNGRINVAVDFEGGSGELAWLTENVNRELAQRGVAASGEPATALKAEVYAFDIKNRRVSAFSPLVTFMHFSADVSQGGKTVRIAAYGKHGKVPVWSMREVYEPCYNRPLQRLVGELVAKLNRHFVGARASAESVASAARGLSSLSGAELLTAVSELGWSNHPDALAPLSGLLGHTDEEVRGAALAAIGTLGVPASFATLKSAYEAPATHTDRFAALAAIGDLGTPEALAFLGAVAASPGDQAEEIRAITELYLRGTPLPQAAVAAR